MKGQSTSMHVVVTGGAGYIGSVLVPMLLERGARVTVLDRCYFGVESLREPQARHGDALRVVRSDVRRVDSGVFEGADALVDLSGISNDPSCELDEELTRSVNLEGSRRSHRLALAAGARRIVFVSSCSVYGHASGLDLHEGSPLRPVSLYARCKAEVEQTALELGSSSGACVTVLRLATVFGVSPRMRFDLAVNVMTKNAYVNRRIVVDGGGRQWRPFVHVRDVAECVARTLDADERSVAGQVLNVGRNDCNSRIANLAYRVRDAMPGTEIVTTKSDPDRRDYRVNFDKLRRVLDWTPSRTIDDGIAELREALRDGSIDPDDRRTSTLAQYAFLAEVERTFREMQLDGRILA
ncbi:MAG TPA: SDR family oxidoreductase [Polyangiaceae bacterium]|nr:SDR family oxidoreductase [Polyangiaceae bacterium]